MLFQTCMTYLLLWNTKVDILKNACIQTASVSIDLHWMVKNIIGKVNGKINCLGNQDFYKTFEEMKVIQVCLSICPSIHLHLLSIKIFFKPSFKVCFDKLCFSSSNWSMNLFEFQFTLQLILFATNLNLVTELSIHFWMAQIPPTKPHLQLTQCKIKFFGFQNNYEQYSVGLYGLYKNELSTKHQPKTVNTSITLNLQLSWPLHTLLFATQPRLRSFISQLVTTSQQLRVMLLSQTQ